MSDHLHKGSEFWDEESVFERTNLRSARTDTPNETLEKPVILDLIGNVKGKGILDLGCGNGAFGAELLSAGCLSYIGVESSKRMIEASRYTEEEKSIHLVHARIEDYVYPKTQFDLVVSRLALHYVSNLRSVFESIFSSLKPEGRFIFSIVHPVITSSDKSRELSSTRHDWIVDDYFNIGPRKVRFMGHFVEQFHRPLEDIYRSLQEAGFIVDSLREASPHIDHFSNTELFERRKRIPLFLFLSSRKPV